MSPLIIINLLEENDHGHRNKCFKIMKYINNFASFSYSVINCQRINWNNELFFSNLKLGELNTPSRLGITNHYSYLRLMWDCLRISKVKEVTSDEEQLSLKSVQINEPLVSSAQFK